MGFGWLLLLLIRFEFSQSSFRGPFIAGPAAFHLLKEPQNPSISWEDYETDDEQPTSKVTRSAGETHRNFITNHPQARIAFQNFNSAYKTSATIEKDEDSVVEEPISKMIADNRIGIPSGFFEPDFFSKRSNQTSKPMPKAPMSEYESLEDYCTDYNPSVFTAPLMYPDPNSLYHYIICRGRRPIRQQCPHYQIFSRENERCVVDSSFCDCLNGGVCRMPNGENRGFSCECRSGFSGERCETIDDPCLTDVCSPGNCLNVTNERGYICQCEDYVFGDACDHQIPNRCAQIFPARLYSPNLADLPEYFVYCTDSGLAFVKKCPNKTIFDESKGLCVRLDEIPPPPPKPSIPLRDARVKSERPKTQISKPVYAQNEYADFPNVIIVPKSQRKPNQDRRWSSQRRDYKR